MQRRLRVVAMPQDGARAVMRLDEPSDDVTVTVTEDDEAPDLICGACEALLATGIRFTTVDDLVIECPACGACNDTADTAPSAG